MTAQQPTPLTPSDLAAALRSVVPGAALVAPRVLRRVIKKHRRIPGLGLQVPHAEGYWIPRGELALLVDPDELPCPVRELADPALLIALPDEEHLAQQTRGDALVDLWRSIFHLQLHLHFDGLLADGIITPAAVRHRIHRIGQAEFDEVRSVLRQHGTALPPLKAEPADVALYGEFAALYLELLHFEPASVPLFFPILTRSRERLESILGEDFDARTLMEASRPDGCPDPELEEAVVREGGDPLTSTIHFHPDPVAYLRLVADAKAAGEAGNDVRAAILYQRAVVAAGPAQAQEAGTLALTRLDALARRLTRMLPEGPRPGVWTDGLRPLLHASVDGFTHGEGRLLYDLQTACNDGETESYRVDLIEWALSLGKRRIKRPLPSLRVILPFKRLAMARSRLAGTRLTDADRDRLAPLLRRAADGLERRARDQLRPVLHQALERSGLPGGSRVAEVARRKLVEELLDRIVERGFFSFSELRDAIAQNPAKLGDLSGPKELLLGDPLLRLDKALAAPLEGVYRRGEVYLRFLQRVSSLFFGTALGRGLVRYALLPFLVAFVALAGLGHVVRPLLHWAVGIHFRFSAWPNVAVLTALLVGVFNSAGFRRGLWEGLRACGRGLRWAFVAAPRWVLDLPLVRYLRESRPWLFFTRLLLKPALIVFPVYLLLELLPISNPLVRLGSVGMWILATLFFNSVFGRRFEEWLGDLLIRSWRRLAHQIVPGLVRWVLALFEALLDLTERVFYTVDEFLRFRRGESAIGLVIKAVLGVFWFFVTYLVRIYIRILVEPQVNPIKHFPVVTVSHKVILPMTFTITEFLARPLSPLGPVIANTVAVSTVFLLPGVFGFLAWESRANWTLYDGNRPAELVEASVGHHGENVLRLVKPGFHSGTLVKLYDRLRRVRGRGLITSGARARRSIADGLHHVEEGIRHFVERDGLAFVDGSRAWQASGRRILVSDVQLASNRIRVCLELTGLSGARLAVAFEEQSGWLLAGVTDDGLLGRLSAGERQVLEIALVGIYKRAGVHLVREMIIAALPGRPAYDVADEGLVVWPGKGYRTELVYPLRTEASTLVARLRHSEGYTSPELPSLPADRVFFRSVRFGWTEWVEAWERDLRGEAQPENVLGGAQVLPG